MIPFCKFCQESDLEQAAFRLRQIVDVNRQSGQTKLRRLAVPNQAMRRLHQTLLKWLRSEIKSANIYQLLVFHSYGAQLKRSPLLQIEQHLANRFFFCLDLQGAYQNVDLERLAKLAVQHLPKTFGRNPKQAVKFLARYCSAPGITGLAIGAPASPDLFNFYRAATLDDSLRLLAQEHGLTYTNYLDDLCFSSRERIGKNKRQKILAAVRHAGFLVKDQKIQVVDSAKNAVVICGLGLRNRRLFVPRRYLQTCKGLLLLALDEPPAFQRQVAGVMSVLRQCQKRFILKNRLLRDIKKLHTEFQKSLKSASAV
ncbi:MAG: reverse transcriptase domain-containing protein [Patescibacteria group bacterium]|jgi:hypothetical protein